MPETVKKRLTQEQIEVVSSKIAGLKNKTLQQSAFVSLLAAEMFSKYLEENGVEVCPGNSLYPVLPVFESFDLTSITANNNVIIDIRAVLGDSYPQLCVPAKHISRGIQPDIYVGARIDKNLENIEFTGFMKADGLSCQKGNRHYFVIDVNEMRHMNELSEEIASIGKDTEKYLALDHQKTTNLLIPFIDGTATEKEAEYVVQHLLNCEECRRELIDLYNIDNSLKRVKAKLLLKEDYSLQLFNGDPLFEGKETTIEFIEDEDEEQIGKIEEEAPLFEEDEDEMGLIKQSEEAVFIDEDEEEEEEEVVFARAESETVDFDEPDEEQEATDAEAMVAEEDAIVFDDESVVQDGAVLESEANVAATAEEAMVAEDDPVDEEPVLILEDQPELEIGESKDVGEPDEVQIETEEPVFELMSMQVQDEIVELAPAPEPEEKIQEETVELAQVQEPAADITEEATPVEQKKPAKRYVDWADELVHKRESEEKYLLSDDNIPKQDLNEFFDRSDLEKDLIKGFDLSADDNFATNIDLDEKYFVNNEQPKKVQQTLPPPHVEVPLPEEHKEEEKNEEVAHQESEKPEETSHAKDDEVNSILGSLDEVETINEEDDIESLFAFFGKADSPKPTQSKEPEIKSPQPAYKPVERPLIYESDDVSKKVTATKDGDYGTILSAGGSEQGVKEDEIDILLYEEGRANVEVINQEELMNIFNSDASEQEAATKEKKSLNFALGSLFKDRNIVAFTVAISLSTTVLFLYLGQINQQININNIDVIKKADQPQETAKPMDKPILPKEGEKREPLLSYTREVVKTVKEEPEEAQPEDMLKKALSRNGVSSEESTLEPKVVEIKNVSWELSATVANNSEMKNYFLETGYALKDRLAQDLYMPNMINNGAEIIISASIDTDGNILKTEVKTSSGSEEIDRRSVATFRSVIKNSKFPEVELDRDVIRLNLIINI